MNQVYLLKKCWLIGVCFFLNGCTTKVTYSESSPSYSADLSSFTCENLITEESRARRLMIWLNSTEGEQANHDKFKGLFALLVFSPASPFFFADSASRENTPKKLRDTYDQVSLEIQKKGCNK